MDPRIRFLIALGSAIRNGAVKTIKQAMNFAEQQFGKIDKSFVDDIVKVFKKEGKTKKGEVVPIKTEEGIVAADAAKEIVKKRTKDIAKGDVTGETSDLMTKIESDLESLKKTNKKLQETTSELTDNPFDDFQNYVLGGGKARDPRQGVVRAAAREILNKNKVNIGREDPIEVFRKMYGEDGLEAIDAVSDGLLDAQSYGEMNTILTQNKLFDLVPKKTYGYDQSVVSAEKIRKAKEQEAKNKQLLEEFEIDPDREPNAYGGIAGNLRLNRTGYFAGRLVKGYQAGKAFWELLKDPKKIRAAVDDIFSSGDYKLDAEMAADALVENNPKTFKGLLREDLPDNISSEIYGSVLRVVQSDLAKAIQLKRLSKPTKTLEGIKKTGTIDISDPNVADEFARFMKETDPEGAKKIEQTVELSNFNPKGRKKNAEGGLIDILKL